MAALIKHCTISCSLLNKKNLHFTSITGSVYHNVIRCMSKYQHKKKGNRGPVFKSKWEWTEESLSSRGFLRPLKPYEPTGNISERLKKVCEINNISPEVSTVIDNFEDRFKLFAACEKEFKYSLPNSILHTIETIEDIKTFYETPINTTPPLENAIKMDLPKNLHIETKYVRFHPDTDTKFNGKTAFPKSSTLVTGIKYKKIYPSLIQKSPFE